MTYKDNSAAAETQRGIAREWYRRERGGVARKDINAAKRREMRAMVAAGERDKYVLGIRLGISARTIYRWLRECEK